MQYKSIISGHILVQDITVEGQKQDFSKERIESVIVKVFF